MTSNRQARESQHQERSRGVTAQLRQVVHTSIKKLVVTLTPFTWSVGRASLLGLQRLPATKLSHTSMADQCGTQFPKQQVSFSGTLHSGLTQQSEHNWNQQKPQGRAFCGEGKFACSVVPVQVTTDPGPRESDQVLGHFFPISSLKHWEIVNKSGPHTKSHGGSLTDPTGLATATVTLGYWFTPSLSGWQDSMQLSQTAVTLGSELMWF